MRRPFIHLRSASAPQISFTSALTSAPANITTTSTSTTANHYGIFHEARRRDRRLIVQIRARPLLFDVFPRACKCERKSTFPSHLHRTR